MKKKLKTIAYSNELYAEDYISDFRSVQQFLEKNHLHHIVRASKHYVTDGLKAYHNKRMLSLYSAPHCTSSNQRQEVALVDVEDTKAAIIRYEHPTSMEYHLIPFLTRLDEE